MSYRILILPRAQRDLAAASSPQFETLETKLLALGEDPRPPGCQKLSKREGWRIRVGDYRIIYEIDDAQKFVTILRVGHRREIYR